MPHFKDMKKKKQKCTTTTTPTPTTILLMINDHPDILIEILKRLDDRSLGVAACVCKLWCSISRNDLLWENLCFRYISNNAQPAYDVRHVVVALGGYRRLYMACLRPVLSRLSKMSSKRRKMSGNGGGGSELDRGRRVWTRDEVQLSLSLFCVHYYEKKLGGGGRLGEASSLMFLCNVS